MVDLKPVILGCAGPSLSADEQRFFAAVNPFGFILFQRNCENPDQVRSLVSSLRESVGRLDAPVFVDQEGGRVARFKSPHWPIFPAVRHIGELYEKDAALGRKAVHLHTVLIAALLRDLGINGNCAPVLDLRIEGASSSIGDRAVSRDPAIVAACGQIAVDTYLAHGIYPVIKHMPGHGRVRVDPHIELPFVEDAAQTLEDDFAPFAALRDAPMAMNCHVVFRALDSEKPVSLSRRIHRDILRGQIGFSGLILSDDLAMGALRLPLAERAVCALEAGADLALYCTGVLEESEAVCAPLAPMGEGALARWANAQKRLACAPAPVDVAVMRNRFDRLMDIAVTLAA